MMNSPLVVRSTLVALIVSLICLTGCPPPHGSGSGGGRGGGQGGGRRGEVAVEGGTSDPAEAPARTSTAAAEDVEAAKTLLDGLGPNAKYTLLSGGVMTEIAIPDGSGLSAENIALFGKLSDLETLQILNYRSLNDEMASQLAGLENLTTLALTNSVIGDPTVELIAESFPNLTNLDLSSNTNMTSGVLKVVCGLGKLERLTLVQNRFNDLSTGRLSKLENLRVLDIRGNMEAGDMTMEVLGVLPKLTALKHRSTTVTDFGMEYLAQSKTLSALLIQDFGITSQAGEQIAKLDKLTQLEIFRCQGFGSDGVLALKGMKLSRLTLRDLPMIDDMAMEVFADLPELKRLYLHENDSISDEGLKNLEALKSLEVLDIWSVSQMSDATVDVIATLPNLKELSIKVTGVTDAAVDKLLAMPKLESLTFKDNGSVTAEGLEKLAGKDWAKLDVGQ
ncbi:leucine-rich repeat domain-containing protein [Planctomycetota bacterium]